MHPLYWSGACGDPGQESDGVWGKVGGGRATGRYKKGGIMEVEIAFTAFHKVLQ